MDTTSYHPGDSQFTTDTVIKILLGAIDGLVDVAHVPPPAFPRPRSAY